MNELTIKKFDGELFTSKDTVRVVGRPRPLLQEHINVELPAGHTVAELIDMACGERKSHLPVNYAAYVDGVPIPLEMRDRVRLKPGHTLTFEPRLAGSAGRNIALIAVAVVALVVSIMLPPLLPAAWGIWATVAASAISAGIVVGGSLAVNALFPIAPQNTPLKELSDASAKKSVYSITGARNSAAPWEAVPSVLGRMRIYPHYAALPFTTFSGVDMYLRMLFVVGYGPLEMDSFKIGETDFFNFESVSLEEFEGYASDGSPTIYTRAAFEEPLTVDLSSHDGTWFERTTETNISDFSGDISVPQGWFAIDDNGKSQGVDLKVRVEYRISGSSDPWVTVLDKQDNNFKKKNPYRFGFSQVVTQGPAYDVRVRSTSDTPNKFQLANTMHWITLRSFTPGNPINFNKPLALIAVKIKASGQLNSQIDTFNLIVASKVNAFDGTTWDGPNPINWRVSSNPADLIRHVLQGPSIYEAVPDAQLDLTSIEAFWQYCDTEGWEYNREHGFRASVYDTLQTIAAAGRGRIVRTDGKWGVIWDEANVAVAQHFSHRNSWGFEEFRTYMNPPHAYRCPFVNEQKGWSADERIVYADTYDSTNATIFESIEFPGITHPDKLWRLARFQMAQTLLRPSTYTMMTNWQALSCTIGSRVYVNHDVAEWGLAAGRVIRVVGNTLTLDEEVTLELGFNYLIRFRQPDGTSVTRVVTVPAIGATKTLVLAASASPTPEVGDLVMFGNDVGGESVLLRVRDIEWLPDLNARLTLVDDAPEISLADTGPIPAYDSQVTPPVDVYLRQPYGLQVISQTYLIGSVPFIRAMITWGALAVDVQAFEVEMRDDNLAVPIWEKLVTVGPHTLSAEAADLDPGTYSFRVRSIFSGNLGWSAWTELNFVQLLSSITPPADVTGFNITSLGDVSLLSWDPVAAPNISHYVIRQSGSSAGVTWGTASILFSSVTGTSTPAPQLTGTYLIKAVSVDGLESANPTTIITTAINLRNLNVVYTLDHSPTWPGILTNLTIDVGELLLSGGSSPPDGLYEFDEIVDLLDIYTSRIGTNLVAYGDNINNFISSWLTLSQVLTLSGALDSDWLVRIEERHTSDDPFGSPVSWSAWTELVVTDITARAFDFRMYLYSFNPDVDVRVTTADITIDMPDRLEGIGDFVVSDTGTPHVTFSTPFKFLETVLVTAIQGASTGDYSNVTNKDVAGFDIEVFDSTDTRVIRTVDILAVGYGKAVP